MMIDFAASRAMLLATPGDRVAIDKTDLQQLIDAAEAGARAERHNRMVGAVVGMAGIARVSAAHV